MMRLFGWCVVLIWFYIQNKVQGQCPAYSPFVVKQGYRLYGHVIYSLYAEKEVLCRLKCNINERCLTFNYEAATEFCELNDADHEKDLQKAQAFAYVDVKKPRKSAFVRTSISLTASTLGTVVSTSSTPISRTTAIQVTRTPSATSTSTAPTNSTSPTPTTSTNPTPTTSTSPTQTSRIETSVISSSRRITTANQATRTNVGTSAASTTRTSPTPITSTSPTQTSRTQTSGIIIPISTTTKVSTSAIPITSTSHTQTSTTETSASTTQTVKPDASISSNSITPITGAITTIPTTIVSTSTTLPTARPGTCSNALGMESRMIKDNQLTASSSDSHYPPSHARLNHQGSWIPKYRKQKEWLQINLNQIKTINGVATQGSHYHNFWVKRYSLVYKNPADGSFIDHPVNFKGNSDHQSIVFNTLSPSMITQVVRIVPKKWERFRALRVELYGCPYKGV